MSLSNDSIAEGADLNLRSVRTEMQSFLLRLHAIIQSNSKGIQWSNAGSAFIITDEHLFRTEILDQHFPRFKDISSFGNYLVHKYGFERIENSSLVEFRHVNFHQNHPKLIQNIRAINSRTTQFNGCRFLCYQDCSSNDRRQGLAIPADITTEEMLFVIQNYQPRQQDNAYRYAMEVWHQLDTLTDRVIQHIYEHQYRRFMEYNHDGKRVVGPHLIQRPTPLAVNRPVQSVDASDQLPDYASDGLAALRTQGPRPKRRRVGIVRNVDMPHECTTATAVTPKHPPSDRDYRELVDTFQNVTTKRAVEKDISNPTTRKGQSQSQQSGLEANRTNGDGGGDEKIAATVPTRSGKRVKDLAATNEPKDETALEQGKNKVEVLKSTLKDGRSSREDDMGRTAVPTSSAQLTVAENDVANQQPSRTKAVVKKHRINPKRQNPAKILRDYIEQYGNDWERMEKEIQDQTKGDVQSRILHMMRTLRDTQNDRSSPSKQSKGPWTLQEVQNFAVGFQMYGRKWFKISNLVPSRTTRQVKDYGLKYAQRRKQAKILSKRDDNVETNEVVSNEEDLDESSDEEHHDDEKSKNPKESAENFLSDTPHDHADDGGSQKADDEDLHVVKESRNGITRQGIWTKSEKRMLKDCIKKYGNNWDLMAKIIGTRSKSQVRCRAGRMNKNSSQQTTELPSSETSATEAGDDQEEDAGTDVTSVDDTSNNGLTGRWTVQEFKEFLEAFEIYGKKWSQVAELIPTRTSKQVKDYGRKYVRKLQYAQSSGENTFLVGLVRRPSINYDVNNIVTLKIEVSGNGKTIWSDKR